MLGQKIILFLAAKKLRQKLGGDASVAALAGEMKISRASLYSEFDTRTLQSLLKPDSS